jgi:hypothetical protein
MTTFRVSLQKKPMAIIVALTKKRLSLVLDAIHARIEAEVARYQITPPSEDAAGDYGNDLHNLRLQRDELLALQKTAPDSARVHECWNDPADLSISLHLQQNTSAMRQQGLLSDQATLQYTITAQTGEEAMAIHYLRQGWAPYVPMGQAAPCPKCEAQYYPEGYGDCWRCGHIG